VQNVGNDIIHISLYGKGHRLKVSENRMLRRIVGPERKELMGSWGRLHE
jgi:hypothetical protein